MTWLRSSIALVAVLVSACSPSEGPAGVIVTNDLEMTVRMTYVVDAAEESLSDELHGDVIGRGEKKEFTVDMHDPDNPTGCTRGDLVARTEQGLEVARIPPPLCGGRIPTLSTWRVPTASP